MTLFENTFIKCYVDWVFGVFFLNRFQDFRNFLAFIVKWALLFQSCFDRLDDFLLFRLIIDVHFADRLLKLYLFYLTYILVRRCSFFSAWIYDFRRTFLLRLIRLSTLLLDAWFYSLYFFLDHHNLLSDLALFNLLHSLEVLYCLVVWSLHSKIWGIFLINWQIGL